MKQDGGVLLRILQLVKHKERLPWLVDSCRHKKKLSWNKLYFLLQKNLGSNMTVLPGGLFYRKPRTLRARGLPAQLYTEQLSGCQGGRGGHLLSLHLASRKKVVAMPQLASWTDSQRYCEKQGWDSLAHRALQMKDIVKLSRITTCEVG